MPRSGIWGAICDLFFRGARTACLGTYHTLKLRLKFRDEGYSSSRDTSTFEGLTTISALSIRSTLLLLCQSCHIFGPDKRTSSPLDAGPWAFSV